MTAAELREYKVKGQVLIYRLLGRLRSRKKSRSLYLKT